MWDDTFLDIHHLERKFGPSRQWLFAEAFLLDSYLYSPNINLSTFGHGSSKISSLLKHFLSMTWRRYQTAQLGRNLPR